MLFYFCFLQIQLYNVHTEECNTSHSTRRWACVKRILAVFTKIEILLHFLLWAKFLFFNILHERVVKCVGLKKIVLRIFMSQLCDHSFAHFPDQDEGEGGRQNSEYSLVPSSPGKKIKMVSQMSYLFCQMFYAAFFLI